MMGLENYRRFGAISKKTNRGYDMYDNTKQFIDRFKETPFDVSVMAFINVTKTLAELVTLAALFQYVATKYSIPVAGLAAQLMNFCVGAYVGNRLGLLTYNELSHRLPRVKEILWVSLPIQISVTIAVAYGAKALIAGVMLQLGQ
ncbi:hypothetical protein XacyCFBP2565_06885 [Xanthomonas arboricola pv. corylina]|uniref:hypothetical protein n=1 Tax=Xanthomonas arboricola TaxID=56448 RepID=UPI000CEE1AF2|nr:hypothetical protein [Xanthomonas arboricola]PPU15543.1 hypothetical protein XacyCFBP2565_06885 [Xanthomonas arboricola pv. corylina]